MRQSRNQSSHIGRWVGLLLFIFVGLAGLILWLAVPMLAENQFGLASNFLTNGQKWSYSAQLLINQKDLLAPQCANAKDVEFTIAEGESINTISANLESQGIISNAKAFRAFLIYAGLDTQVRAGRSIN